MKSVQNLTHSSTNVYLHSLKTTKRGFLNLLIHGGASRFSLSKIYASKKRQKQKELFCHKNSLCKAHLKGQKIEHLEDAPFSVL